MDNEQKSLQKLTDSAASNKTADAKTFSTRAEGLAYVESLLNDPNLPEEQKNDLRNQRWENNHAELVHAIDHLTNKLGRMPMVNELYVETGLSRQTIHKHLNEFYQSARYQNQLNQFRILSERVMGTLYRLATNEGDVRAAKVFLDAVGGLPGPAAPPANQAGNNYIQINNNVKIDQVMVRPIFRTTC